MPFGYPVMLDLAGRRIVVIGATAIAEEKVEGLLAGGATHLVVIGRGRLVADSSVADLIATASAGRVTLRTAARSDAMSVLAHAGATVAATDRDTLTVSGLDAGRVVTLLIEATVPFTEVAANRATLEEAYMELTRDQVEFHATPAEEPAR